jgi:hypothetical protein
MDTIEDLTKDTFGASVTRAGSIINAASPCAALADCARRYEHDDRSRASANEVTV